MNSRPGKTTGATERRLIIARLLEIRRKCKTLSARGEEFAKVEARLQEIIAVLGAGKDPQGRPPDYLELARSLQPAERLFESSGFLNVAREVALAAQALHDLAGPVPAETQAPLQAKKPTGPKITSAHRQHEPQPEEEQDEADGNNEERQPVFSLLAAYGGAGMLIFWVLSRRLLALDLLPSSAVAVVTGAVVGALLVWLHLVLKPLLAAGGSRKVLAIACYSLVITPWCVAGAAALALISAGFATPPTLQPQPTPAPAQAAIPSAARTPAPTPDAQQASPASVPRDLSPAMLPAIIGEARQALGSGDLGHAIEHLNEAAVIEPFNSLVLEIAAEVLAGLLEVADSAAQQQDWATAEESLARARDIARRFELDSTPIDEAAARHARAVRWVDLRPTQVTAIRNASGRRVTVTLTGGGTLEGKVRGLRGAFLLLDMEPELGQGNVAFTKEIPLPTVLKIRVFERLGAGQKPGSD